VSLTQPEQNTLRLFCSSPLPGVASAWQTFCIKYTLGRAHFAGAQRKVNDMKTRCPFTLLAGLAIACVLAAAQPQQDVSEKAVARIQKEVRHELLMLPYLGVFDNLAYKVDGYNVTLMGQVTRPVLKSDAENAVKRIEGVEKVDNQIEVLPTSPMDDQLRRSLYRAIYGYAALEKYSLGVQQPIRIVVKNGHVTLEGVVDNEGDKNMAGLRANGVAGVFSVTNNLQVAR
jgi:hyperosmotically inducible protein